ncbi:MAG: hypothetical protein ACC645_21560, partial [Pirellulales bacterium]
MLTDWGGASAPAGLTRYESQVFGPEFQDSLFAALFNYHKVTRHVLQPDGATFKTGDEDFLACERIEFHPTDVLEDADGSLLVIETGGWYWYRHCCPTSRFYKPQVAGAIYRIRRTGAPAIDDPRGLKLDWKGMSPVQLAGLLADDRPAVGRRAIHELAKQGEHSLAALRDVVAPGRRTGTDLGSAEARRNAVWAATRIDRADARAVARAALGDADEAVRQAALHSLTFALIEIADRDATAAGLKSKNVHTRRAAMTALDQMPGGDLAPQVVAAELDSPDPKLQETAWWIAGRHSEWGDALADALRRQVAAKGRSPAEREQIASRLAQFARTPAMRTWLAEQLSGAEASRESKQIVLRAMARTGGKNIPGNWITALTSVLGSEDVELFADAITTVRDLQIHPQQSDAWKDVLAPLRDALRQVTRNTDFHRDLRLQAAAAVPGGLDEANTALFQLLLGTLDADEAPPARSAAVEALSRSRLNAVQFLQLAAAFESVGPMEIGRLLEPFKRTTDDRVGRQLVAALRTAPAAASLRVEQIMPIVSQFGPQVQKEAEPLLAALAPT